MREKVNLLVYGPDPPYQNNQIDPINNQNQEVFIVIIINHKLRVCFLCLLCKILFLEKYRP